MMRDYDIKFVNKEITPFGGLSLFLKMLDRCHFDEQLVKSGIPSQGSNRGYNPVSSYLDCLQESGAVRVASDTLTLSDMTPPFAIFWDGIAELTTGHTSVISTSSHKRPTSVCSASCSVGSFPSWCLTTTRLTSIPRSWSVRAVRKEQPRGITRSVRAGPLIIRSWPSCRTSG